MLLPFPVRRSGHSCWRGRAGGKLGQHLRSRYGNCFSFWPRESAQGRCWARAPPRQWAFPHSWHRGLREGKTLTKSHPRGLKQSQMTELIFLLLGPAPGIGKSSLGKGSRTQTAGPQAAAAKWPGPSHCCGFCLAVETQARCPFLSPLSLDFKNGTV